MAKKGIETMPSKTALITSLYRAVANKEYGNPLLGPDYLAEKFLPFHVRFLIKSSKMRARGKAKGAIQTPGVYEYMLARTAFFDDVFIDALNESIPPIVLLGAGYDTRAYRFSDINNCTRIIEIDNAATQNRKLKALKKSSIDTSEKITHIPVDFNKDSLKDVLKNAGYKDDQKTLFIWEGVCMYLEPKSVDATIGYIANSTHGESVIAFDYAVSIADDNRHRYFGAEELISKLNNIDSNESLKFTIDEEIIESFLNQRGLKLTKHFDHKQIKKTFLIRDDGTFIGQPNGIFRLAMASPKRDL